MSLRARRTNPAPAVPELAPRLTRYIPHRPTPHQGAFLLLDRKEAFYGGAAGGGKSDALLMAALQYADVRGYAALLVRETYAQLSQPGGLMWRASAWLASTDAVWNATEHTWRFPSGATLTFRHLAEAGAERNVQGAEYQFIGVDEVTDLTEDEYRFLFSRLRRLAGSQVPLRMRAASNPYGPGLEWCYRRFILEAREQDRVFIPAHLEDNPHLDASYEDSLKELGPIAYRQLRYGDWTVRPEGGLFRRAWFDGCSIGRRELPSRLTLCRYWDLAGTEATRGKDPDYTAGVLLGRSHEGLWYVLDVVRARSTPLAVERLVAATAERDAAWARKSGRTPPAIRMEQEPGSAGVAVIDHYRRKVLAPYDFRGVRSTGSKETRAQPVGLSRPALDRMHRGAIGSSGRWFVAVGGRSTARRFASPHRRFTRPIPATTARRPPEGGDGWFDAIGEPAYVPAVIRRFDPASWHLTDVLVRFRPGHKATAYGDPWLETHCVMEDPRARPRRKRVKRREEFTRSTPREQPSPASAGCSSRLTRRSRSSWGSGPRMSDPPGPGLRSGFSLPFGDSPVEQHRHDSNRIDQDHHEPSCIRGDVAQQDRRPCIA